MKFLQLETYEEAIKKINEIVSFDLQSEDTSLASSLNRILAEALIAPIDIPHYPKSQMDGYALRSEDTFEASETSPIKLKLIESVNAGSAPKYSIEKNKCSYVATGAPIPEGADSVVMIENTQTLGEYITLARGVVPGENIMKVGYDIKKGSQILSKNTLITPRIIGLLSGLGIRKVKVYRKLKLAFFQLETKL